MRVRMGGMPADHRPQHHVMPRFSLKQLLLSTALIAGGTASLAYWVTSDSRLARDNWNWFFLLWESSGAAVGVGVFSLFNRPWIGAFVGCLIAFAGMVILTMVALSGIKP